MVVQYIKSRPRILEQLQSDLNTDLGIFRAVLSKKTILFMFNVLHELMINCFIVGIRPWLQGHSVCIVGF